MKPLLALLALVILCPSALSNSDKVEMNGIWWANNNPSFRLGWVSGYAKAMDYAGTIQLATCASNMPLYQAKFPNLDPKALVQDLCLSDKNFDYDGISMGQFVDGIDTFYRDYRNRQIEIGWAIEYVRDAIKGKPEAELEAEVGLWRRCTAASQTGIADQISKACTPTSSTPPSQ